jgi:hypothetical protein
VPVDFQIHPDCGCVVVRASGRVSAGDVTRYVEQLRAHPDFAPDMPRLVDARGVDELPTADELRTLARGIQDATSDDPCRRALVASRDHLFGMLRLFEMTASDGPQYAVFRSVDEAAEWLGLDCVPIRLLSRGEGR